MLIYTVNSENSNNRKHSTVLYKWCQIKKGMLHIV